MQSVQVIDWKDAGVVASVGWWEVWRPSPKVDPGAFSGQRQGWKTPKRTPGSVLVCSGSVLLRDLLGVSRSRERDLLSVLLIYPRIFFCVFIVLSRSILLYVDECWLLWFSCHTPPPFPFGRISIRNMSLASLDHTHRVGVSLATASASLATRSRVP